MPPLRKLRCTFKARVIPCPFDCGLFCKSASGVTQHRHVCSLNPANRRATTPGPCPVAPQTPRASSPWRFPSPPRTISSFRTPRRPRGCHTPVHGSPRRYRWIEHGRGVRSRKHPLLDGKSYHVHPVNNSHASYTGQPCDEGGYDLPEDAPPIPEDSRADNDYFPFSSRAEFELTDFLFRREQMAGKKITELMEIFASLNADNEDEWDPSEGLPFASAQEMYAKIDSTELGDVAWQVCDCYRYQQRKWLTLKPHCCRPFLCSLMATTWKAASQSCRVGKHKRTKFGSVTPSRSQRE